MADVEAFIHTAIARRYPEHGFVGEETYSRGATRDYLIDDARPTWCVDPLDGTVNYTHLFPMFCVSIGLVAGPTPLVGVICAPFLGQLFSSCAGRGAWMNETQRLPLVRSPVPPVPEDAPKGCVFSCEWGKDRRDVPDGNLSRKVESFVNMASEIGGRGGKGGMVHGVRSLGRRVSAPLPVWSGCRRWADSEILVLVRPLTWHTQQWAASTYGGRLGAGSGKPSCLLSGPSFHF